MFRLLSKKWGLFFFIALIALSFVLHFNYVMNHIFVDGSGMADVGWFVHLTTNSHAFPIQNPEMAGLSETYFSTHFSPFFYITSALYHLVSPLIGQHSFFSFFMSLSYVIIPIAAYFLMRGKEGSSYEAVFFYILAASLAFNGVFLGSTGFPHFEVIIPSLAILVVSLYFSGYFYSTFLVFLFLLLIREDAGLHAALLFTIISGLYFLQERKVSYVLLVLSVIGLFYGFSSIAIQKYFFPGDNAFERIYSGMDFYDHISIDFIKDRFLFFASERAYLWTPWLVAIFSAIKMRSFIMLAGFIFAIPWTVLSVTAVSPMTNSLSNYYAFPLAISCAWPIIAILINRKINGNVRVHRRSEVLIAASATILSVILFDGSGHVDSKPWEGMSFAYKEVVEETQYATNKICRRKSSMGNVLIDESVSALMPSCLSKNEWGFLNKFHDSVKDKADVIIFYDSNASVNGRSVDAFMAIADRAGIDSFYKVKGTKVVIGSEKINIVNLGFEAGVLDWNYNNG